MRALLALLLSGAALAQTSGRWDTTLFIALGDGLPAGMGDFGLHQRYQERSFPALVAAQMKALFPQPLLEAPGLGGIPGYPDLPVRAPGPLGTTLRTPFPPTLFVFNLSVPGMKAAGASSIRVRPPLVHPADMQQTALNFIVGFPSLLLGKDKPLSTQVEAAVSLNPTSVLICYGYSDVLDAAAAGDPALLPDPAAFRSAYQRVVDPIRATFARILIVNIPDPMDSAYAITPAAAGRYLNVTPARIQTWWRAGTSDFITPAGLLAMGEQLDNGTPGAALPNGSVIAAAAATAIRDRVTALNREIAAVAQGAGADLHDLAALIRRVREGGAAAGGVTLTADYMGGFYTLNGFYPGNAGNAIIANDILTGINRRYSTQFPMVDLAGIVRDDPSSSRLRPSSSKGESR
ncbi:MAG: hypothetical protein FJW39_30140 [Acidobacteria bacterium]|nr:hypothetical protein [Acidobacteriota bacterium]